MKKAIVIKQKPSSSSSSSFNQTITITFGDVAENHVGMQKIGNLAPEGFSHEDLVSISEYFSKLGAKTELIDLVATSYLDADKVDPAHILVIRNAVKYIGDVDINADSLYKEQDKLNPDTKAKMRGRVVNKKARYNLCFNDKSQEPDFDKGLGTVIDFDSVPLLKQVREELDSTFGEKARDIKAEGNYYYDTSKCGIGYHGDSERRIVIGLRLGKTMPLCYQWYHRFNPIGLNVKLNLHHGDMYVMSDKATGHDWKKSSQITLRHAAGCLKYITVKISES